MIDLHTHILPGLDDGARRLVDSLEMARLAVADGVRVVAATPHVRDDYPTAPSTMERRVSELRDALRGARIELDVRTGGEIALDRLDALSRDERARFGLGGNPRYLLLEWPYYGWPLALGTQVHELVVHGVTPVIAHPERSPDVQAAPERLRPLVDGGVLLQVTAASLDGRLGQPARAAGLELIRLGLAHLVASDAHAPAVREIGMSSAAVALGDPALVRWLTHDVPAAIVEDTELPARPRPAPRRRPRFRDRWQQNPSREG